MRIQYLWIMLAVILGACQSDSGLSGHWALDRDRSSNIDSWRTIELRITATDDRVGIGRILDPRRSARRDSVNVPTNDTQVAVPMAGSAKWLEHHHLGVFIDGKTPQLVRANWDPSGRVLNMQHLQTVQTSQGETTVEILREYALSEDGSELTLVEQRSSRPEPLTFVLTRK